MTRNSSIYPMPSPASAGCTSMPSAALSLAAGLMCCVACTLAGCLLFSKDANRLKNYGCSWSQLLTYKENKLCLFVSIMSLQCSVLETAIHMHVNFITRSHERSSLVLLFLIKYFPVCMPLFLSRLSVVFFFTYVS